MNTAELRGLLAYDEWANARLLAAVDALSAEQAERALGGSFPTVRALASHVVAVEWIWLSRWRGESPAAPPGWMADGVVGLRARLAEVEAERHAFLDDLGEEAATLIVPYRLLDGTPGERRLAELVLHLVNHSTYHRGQLADALRRLGIAPPATDLLAFPTARL